MTAPSRYSRLIDVAVRLRWWGLALACVLSICAWGPASRLKLDESIESFFAPTDPLLLHYLDSKQCYGGDEFVMVGYRLPEPFDTDLSVEQDPQKSMLDELEAFADRLSAVPGVRASSTQDLAHIIRNPRALPLTRIGLLRLPPAIRLMTDTTHQILISQDHTVMTIILRLEPTETAPVPRTETLRQIRAVAAEFPHETFVAGEPVQVHDMFRYVESDGRVLGTTSTVLLLLVILTMFRSVRWVILPLLVVQATLLWTRGLLEVSGLQLSMVSSMLTSLVTIIAIATVMHLTVVYREQRLFRPRDEALTGSLHLLARPIFWTCLTTAVGFASLLSSGITPVRSFGIMMSLGTLLVPVVCLLVLPWGVLFGRWDTDPRPVFAEERLMQGLRRLAYWSATHRGPVLLGASLLVAVAAGGLWRLQIETDFSRNFRPGSEIVRALKFFESNLGGVGTWELGFDAPAELDEEFLDRVRKLSQELTEIELEGGLRLTRVIPFSECVDPIKRLPKPRGGLFALLQGRNLDEAREALRVMQPELESNFYNPVQGRMRIMLRALEQQPAEQKLKLIAEVERVGRQTFPEARATGLYVLLAELISSLLRDQIVSFGITAVAIFLLMTLAFRSAVFGLISLVPNVLPILLVIGGMGWAGIPINIGTAMIASVSLGLTIDSTIHYLNGYTRRKRAGATHLEAMSATHAEVGRALTFANVALIIGFTVLSLSQFIPLVYFGVLVSVAMLGGLICNLVLLPALLPGDGRQRSPEGSHPDLAQVSAAEAELTAQPATDAIS
jgi:predicted RND superfamily exporter protein